MILYTDMPLDLVLQGMDDERKPYEEIQLNGITMLVEQISPNEAKIVRLISPNPNDYLNPAYAPGQTIRSKPVIG